MLNTRSSERPPDAAASLTLALVAASALVAAWLLPWWIMKSQAPQYGKQVLVVEVGPRNVEGDVREVDLLGHYVGIRPMGALARVERALAPVGMAAAIAGVLAAPWLRSRWLRVVAVLPTILMPPLVLADLKVWMSKSVNDRDPEAALNLTVTHIDPKLFGTYEVGQFRITAQLGSGFYLASTAGLLGLGLVFAVPLGGARRRGAAAAAAAGLLLLAGRRGEAAELLVGRTHDSVGGAVAAAHDGDTVVVPPGVFHEHVTIDRTVRLIGRAGAVLDGDAQGTVLRIAAPGVEVRGLTIRNSGDGYTTEDAGIRIDTAANVRIVDTRIEDTLFGIFAAQADDCVIEGSTVIGKDLPHVRRGDSVRLWYSHGCRLAGNHVERSRDFIIWYSARTVVEDNEVRTSRYGLHYMYSDDNVFRHNRFEDNQIGAAIMYSRRIEITENAFSFSDGPAAYGILLKDADDVFITGNRLVHNATGLFLDGAPQSRDGRVDVRGNLIARNAVGIAMQPLSRGVRFWENALVGNHQQVQVLGTGSIEDNTWAVDGRGNYWSDGVVYDRDGDGVSDLAYRAESTFEGLADRHPTLAFFDGTPGAEAIDTAARLFPLFAPRPKLTDPHPLMQPPLSNWTAGGGRAPAGAGLVLAGGVLLAAAALVCAGARRALA